MTEKVAAIPNWIRLKIKPEYFLYLLVLLIPFQQRMYKFFKNFSASLVNPDWNVPVYFEIHLDAFISDFVLLGLIFWCLKKGMEWRSFWEGENKFLSLFLLFALASIVHSSFALYPIHYWRWMHLVLPAFLYFFLRRTQLEEGSFKKMAQIVLVISLIECLIAIPQYFVQHSLGLKGLGEATLIATHYVGSNFPMADGSVWIFDKIFHVIRERTFVLRASGTLTHPNILGGFMVFGLLMTYYIYGVSKKRLALSLAILLQTFCLFITYSRAAIFTACVNDTFLDWFDMVEREKNQFADLGFCRKCAALFLSALSPDVSTRRYCIL